MTKDRKGKKLKKKSVWAEVKDIRKSLRHTEFLTAAQIFGSDNNFKEKN